MWETFCKRWMVSAWKWITDIDKLLWLIGGICAIGGGIITILGAIIILPAWITISGVACTIIGIVVFLLQTIRFFWGVKMRKKFYLIFLVYGTLLSVVLLCITQFYEIQKWMRILILIYQVLFYSTLIFFNIRILIKQKYNTKYKNE